ncbi:hypothetical protein BCF44_1288 [Kutzneria buriramensis]|uniref:Uncharacterized protein n=1 Tax=Kutzneria buriramensis TaxID=1045776 RepID=A0A3E0GVQ7_9PSEU|nr:hypothetical protein BCF44_1288 [Kutzneria buriramensis]
MTLIETARVTTLGKTRQGLSDRLLGTVVVEPGCGAGAPVRVGALGEDRYATP